jgi:hypothetical protein
MISNAQKVLSTRAEIEMAPRPGLTGFGQGEAYPVSACELARQPDAAVRSPLGEGFANTHL